MSVDYNQIKVHPLFEPIKKLFDFFILGSVFAAMPQFQAYFLSIHPAMSKTINDYNEEINRKVNPDGSIETQNRTYLIYISRMMAIAIFDFLQFSKYNNQVSNTPIYRFTKHIRNGAAHNNTFNFSKKTMTADQPVKWRKKTIDYSLKGKTVTPDFITSTELVFLMEDISKMIKD